MINKMARFDKPRKAGNGEKVSLRVLNKQITWERRHGVCKTVVKVATFFKQKQWHKIVLSIFQCVFRFEIWAFFIGKKLQCSPKFSTFFWVHKLLCIYHPFK